MRVLIGALACACVCAQQGGRTYPPTAFVNPTVPTPIISPIGGTYAVSQTVTITETATGSALHYTTDGSTPDCSSTLYTTGISTGGPPVNVTVKAIGCLFGLTSSAVASSTFNISSDPSILPGSNGNVVAIGNNAVTSEVNSAGASLIHIWVFDNTTPTAPTDSASNTWHPLTVKSSSTNYYIQGYYAYAPTTSSTHTFTCHGSATKAACLVYLFQGTYVLGDPLVTENGNSTTSSVQTLPVGSVTPDATNELIVTGLGLGTSTSKVPTISNSAVVVDSNQNTFPKDNDAYLLDTASSAINLAWSWTGGNPCVGAVAVFKHQ